MDVTGAEMGSGHGSDLVQQIKQRQEDHKYKVLTSFFIKIHIE
jgi:hypothetical protein